MYKNALKNLIILTKGERNGIIGLLILLFLLIILRFLMPFITEASEKKDLRKFELEKAEYLKFLQIPDSTDNNKIKENRKGELVNSKTNPSGRRLYIEINKADTAELMKLPGIGPVFSKRIIKYRQLLGGFYSKQQLIEVYGITDDIVKKIADEIYVDTSLISKLNISKADFKVINAHPYITFEQTKAIFDLRRKTNGILENEVLKESGIFDSATLQKVKPYLKFN
jgi:DNA uptake protein ComE-like DNA-binding protein